MISRAAIDGDLNTIQSFESSGVDVTGSIDDVSMSVVTTQKIFISI